MRRDAWGEVVYGGWAPTEFDALTSLPIEIGPIAGGHGGEIGSLEDLEELLAR